MMMAQMMVMMMMMMTQMMVVQMMVIVTMAQMCFAKKKLPVEEDFEAVTCHPHLALVNSQPSSGVGVFFDNICFTFFIQFLVTTT